MEKQKIVEAVSQAWCTPENAHKEMDVVLGMAIVENMIKVLESPTPPEPEGECEHLWVLAGIYNAPPSEHYWCEKCGVLKKIQGDSEKIFHPNCSPR